MIIKEEQLEWKVQGYIRVHKFSKNLGATSNPRRPKGDVKQIPFCWEPTDIRRHSTKFSRPVFVHPWGHMLPLFAFWVFLMLYSYKFRRQEFCAILNVCSRGSRYGFSHSVNCVFLIYSCFAPLMLSGINSGSNIWNLWAWRPKLLKKSLLRGSLCESDSCFEYKTELLSIVRLDVVVNLKKFLSYILKIIKCIYMLLRRVVQLITFCSI
jgi:hypothetical protein